MYYNYYFILEKIIKRDCEEFMVLLCYFYYIIVSINTWYYSNFWYFTNTELTVFIFKINIKNCLHNLILQCLHFYKCSNTKKIIFHTQSYRGQTAEINRHDAYKINSLGGIYHIIII